MIATPTHALENNVTRRWLEVKAHELYHKLKNPDAPYEYEEDEGFAAIVNDAVALDYQSGTERIETTPQDYGAHLRTLYFETIRQDVPETTAEEKIAWTAIARFLWFVVQCEDEGQATQGFDMILGRESREIADARRRFSPAVDSHAGATEAEAGTPAKSGNAKPKRAGKGKAKAKAKSQ